MILIIFISYFHHQRHHKWPSANFYYQNYHFHLFVNNAKKWKFFFVKRWKEGGSCICIITIYLGRRSQPTWTSRRSQRKNTFWKRFVVNCKSVEKMLSHQNHSTTGFLSDLFPLFINKFATRQVREPSWIKTGSFSSSWHSPPCSWSDSYRHN